MEESYKQCPVPKCQGNAVAETAAEGNLLCIRCDTCDLTCRSLEQWVALIQAIRPAVEIKPCPRCGEPCRIIPIRCDKVIVCCTYPKLEYVEEGSLEVRILYGCGYTSAMERHPLDCIQRHNEEN